MSITDKQKSYLLGLYKELHKKPIDLDHLTKTQARTLIQMFLEEKDNIDSAKTKSYQLDKQMATIEEEIDRLYEPIRVLQKQYSTLKEKKLSLCTHYSYKIHKAERNIGSWTTVRIEYYHYAECLDCGHKWELEERDLQSYLVSIYTGDDIEFVTVKKNLIKDDSIDHFIQRCYGKDVTYKVISNTSNTTRTLQL